MAANFPFGIGFALEVVGIQYPFGRASAYLPCPHCDAKYNGRKKRLYINFTDNVWRCNRCDSGGGILHLLVHYGAAANIKEAHKILSDAYGGLKPEIRQRVETEKKKAAEFQGCDEPIVDKESRNKTYEAMLLYLPLHPEHQADLKKRGLPSEIIQRNMYASIPSEAEARELCTYLLSGGYQLIGTPGFFNGPDRQVALVRWKTGYYIPVRDIDHNIVGCQIRFDAGTRYMWLSSLNDVEHKPRDGGCSVSGNQKIHVTGLEYLKDSKVVYVTEGPLKADVASYLSKKPFVGICGLSNRAGLPEVLQRLKKLGAEKIVDAFDMDRFDNPDVMREIKKISVMIEDAGLQMEKIRWPVEWKGIDDFLLHQFQQKQLSSCT